MTQIANNIELFNVLRLVAYNRDMRKRRAVR